MVFLLWGAGTEDGVSFSSARAAGTRTIVAGWLGLRGGGGGG